MAGVLSGIRVLDLSTIVAGPAASMVLADLEAVLRIATTCDVFLENFRGGKAVALGLDEPAVRARRPDIIYACLLAYGATGPDYTRPGYDAVLQARTGIMS